MDNRIFFIGDPGQNKCSILQTVRECGLEPRRHRTDVGLLDAIEREKPLAVVLGQGEVGRRGIVEAIREQAGLAQMPVLAVINAASKGEIECALDDGADDFVVEGDSHKLAALAASLERTDPWNVVRAPKGLAVLAESRREERIRVAHLLRRNGFDVVYAGDASGLCRALGSMRARIVVSSEEIAHAALSVMLGAGIEEKAAAAPWVILCEEASQSCGRAGGEGLLRVSTVNKRDGLESITFVTNELLTPPPPNVRRSKRILYGTPVRFSIEGDGVTFFGYCYNINAGGVFVRTLTPIPTGARVEISMTPPFGRGRIEATAQVVWLSSFKGRADASSPPGMGLQFVEMAPPDRAAYETGYEMLLAHNEDRAAVPNLVTPFSGPAALTEPPPEWWSTQFIA